MADFTRRQFCILGTAASFAALGFAGCSSSNSGASSETKGVKDGVYSGQSSVLDANTSGDGYGIITITVENGAITDAKFQAFLPDGTPKDENYGKDTTSYAVAQRVIKTGDDYTRALIESGSPDGVDAISGATYLHEQFIEATENALKEASK